MKVVLSKKVEAFDELLGSISRDIRSELSKGLFSSNIKKYEKEFDFSFLLGVISYNFDVHYSWNIKEYRKDSLLKMKDVISHTDGGSFSIGFSERGSKQTKSAYDSLYVNTQDDGSVWVGYSSNGSRLQLDVEYAKNRISAFVKEFDLPLSVVDVPSGYILQGDSGGYKALDGLGVNMHNPTSYTWKLVEFDDLFPCKFEKMCQFWCDGKVLNQSVWLRKVESSSSSFLGVEGLNETVLALKGRGLSMDVNGDFEFPVSLILSGELSLSKNDFLSMNVSKVFSSSDIEEAYLIFDNGKWFLSLGVVEEKKPMAFSNISSLF